MRHFGPPTTPGRVAGMEPRMAEIVTDLIDKMAGRSRIDVVDDLAYPLPVTVICELLGVPPGDETALPGLGGHRPAIHRPRPRSRNPAEKAGGSRDGTARFHGRAGRGPPEGTGRRPALGDGHRRRPGRPHAGRAAGEHRASAAHRRTRNHREPHRQRRTDPAPPPARAPEAAQRPRPGHPDGRGAAALRAARAFRPLPHRPRRYRHRPAPPSRQAPPSRCSWPPATATPPTSPTPTSSSRTGPTISTSASAAASTSASARPWPGWKPRSPSPNSPAGSRTRGWSPTRRHTGRARSCADPPTSR